jgi:hypothetical protein
MDTGSRRRTLPLGRLGRCARPAQGIHNPTRARGPARRAGPRGTLEAAPRAIASAAPPARPPRLRNSSRRSPGIGTWAERRGGGFSPAGGRSAPREPLPAAALLPGGFAGSHPPPPRLGGPADLSDADAVRHGAGRNTHRRGAIRCGGLILSVLHCRQNPARSADALIGTAWRRHRFAGASPTSGPEPPRGLILMRHGAAAPASTALRRARSPAIMRPCTGNGAARSGRAIGREWIGRGSLPRAAARSTTESGES